MNFLSLSEQPGRVDNLSLMHRGIVIENRDPLKQGRVKCTIPGIFEDTYVAGDPCEPSEELKGPTLPWVYPIMPVGLGGQQTSGWFSVPELGTELLIVFPFKDVYLPVYMGYWSMPQTKQSLMTGPDYPEVYGWQDSDATHVVVNKKQKSVSVYHGPSTAYITIDKDGNVTAKTGVTYDDPCVEEEEQEDPVEGNFTYEVIGHSDITIHKTAKLLIERTSDTNIKKKTTVLIEDDCDVTIKKNATILVEENADVTVKGDMTVTVEGDTTADLQKNLDATVGENATVDVGGNADVTVAGNLSATADGNVELKSGGTMDLSATGVMSLTAPVINLN